MPYSTNLLRHMRFTIGQNIQKQRVQKRMTLKKLSHLSGVPEDKLDHYELGKNDVSLEHLLRIACVLKVEMGKMIV